MENCDWLTEMGTAPKIGIKIGMCPYLLLMI